jgi:hypothetical protein
MANRFRPSIPGKLPKMPKSIGSPLSNCSAKQEDIGNPNLVFLLPADAKKYGVKPGPAIRICIPGGGGKGALIPVKDAADATAKAGAYRECAQTGEAMACARRLGSKATPEKRGVKNAGFGSWRNRFQLKGR